MDESKIRAICVPLILIFSFLSYLALSSPNGVVAKSNGSVSGLTNKIRATLQGKLFWQDQLQQLDQTIEILKTEPKRMAEMNKKADKLLDELESYSDISEADKLRRIADELEQKEVEAYYYKILSEQIGKLELLRPVIMKKLQ